MDEFTVFAEIDAFEKADAPEGESPMRIGGVVSTEALDADQERVVQEGLDFTPFLEKGWFNDNHGQKATDILGYPTTAKLVRKGDVLPNGKRADKKGWWAEGYLVNTDEGRRIWNLAHALNKAPGKRRLGFSIEGSVKERDHHDNAIVKRGVVRNVAITHCPKNTDTNLTTFAKALMAGSAIENPGTSAGEGFALRAESLEGGKRKRKSGDRGAAIQEIVTVHLSDPEETGGDDIHKGPDQRAEITAEDDMLEWADTFRRLNTSESLHNPSLTKSEARVIVRETYQHLDENEIDQIVNRAAHQRRRKT